MAALKDPAPGVRENAAVLAESYPACLPLLIDRMKDSSVRVAFQATLSAGDFKGQPLADAMADVMAKHGASPWFRTAVLSSEVGSSPQMLLSLDRRHDFFRDTASWKRTFIRDLSAVISARDRKEERLALERMMEGPRMKAQPLFIEAARKGISDTSRTRKQ
jgi:hypothetical protein